MLINDFKIDKNAFIITIRVDAFTFLEKKPSGKTSNKSLKSSLRVLICRIKGFYKFSCSYTSWKFKSKTKFIGGEFIKYCTETSDN